MKNKYTVVGSIEIYVRLEVEADSLVDAEKKAHEMFDEAYNLDVNGAFHDPNEDILYKISVI